MGCGRKGEEGGCYFVILQPCLPALISKVSQKQILLKYFQCILVNMKVAIIILVANILGCEGHDFSKMKYS